MMEVFYYKLRMFGVPIDGPPSVFCDNKAVYQNTVVPYSILKKKQHSIIYHGSKEAVAAGTIRVGKEDTLINLEDLFKRTEI